MSFFSKLFAKLFGRKKEQEAPRVPYTPTVERPPYATTGKWQAQGPVEVYTQEVVHPRVPAVSQPVNLNTQGWPVGTYEFKPGVYYVPYDGSQGGPFKEPKEAFAWMAAVDRRNKSLKEGDQQTAGRVYEGMFPALNFIHGSSEGREAAFIYSANRIMQEAKGSAAGNLYWDFGLFSGSVDDINGLINYGEQEQIFEHRSFFDTYQAFPDTPVGRAVRAEVAKHM